MTDDLITQLGAVVVVAVVLAAFARNRGLNPSLWLLLGGMLVGFVPFGPEPPTDPELVLIVVLAPLVFGEALSSSIVDLRRVRRPVLALAVGLVVIGAFAVGIVAAQLVPGMPLGVALCLGAILGPTDAVAVAATARAAGLPRRVMDILEGESLVNDGTALTLLRVFGLATAAGSITAAEVGVILLQSIAAGLLVGILVGTLLVIVTRRSTDTVVSAGCTLIAPFPCYVGAENVGGSGILAVVAAGLILAHATSSATTYTGRLQSTSVWRTITFVLQATAFFLVGIDFPEALEDIGHPRQLQLLYLVPIVTVTLFAVRFAFVRLMVALRAPEPRIPQAWIVVAWAGTRGPISALAAFTLPLTMDDGSAFPFRSLVISITFCVVVVTLLLAPTIAPLARRLDLPKDDADALLRHARVALARASLDRLEEISQHRERTRRPLPHELLDALRENAEQRLDLLSTEQEHGEHAAAVDPQLRRELLIDMVQAEHVELVRLRDEEGLPDSVMRTIQKELDVRLRAFKAP